MLKTIGFAAQSPTSELAPFQFERRAIRPNDILVDILFCGICHSDLHVVRDEWKKTIFPVVPGHEIIGRVMKTGSAVKKFKEGDLVGVGCIADCCRICYNCTHHLEQYCDQGYTLVFNSSDPATGMMNYGGFSKQIVIEERFTLKIPETFHTSDLARAAPLLCAGITTYSPLKTWKVGKDAKVGIIGLGGLGHLAVKLAHAMKAHVVLFTTSPHKAQEAKALGASEVVFSKNIDEMNSQTGKLDFILSTVAFPYDLAPYINLLAQDGTMCLVGLPPSPHPSLPADALIRRRRRIAGSLIGGIQETQEMLDFCAQHQILADIELIPMKHVNEAFARMEKNDVKYRFVIDTSSNFI